jgi:hypothetical protein
LRQKKIKRKYNINYYKLLRVTELIVRYVKVSRMNGGSDPKSRSNTIGQNKRMQNLYWSTSQAVTCSCVIKLWVDERTFGKNRTNHYKTAQIVSSKIQQPEKPIAPPTSTSPFQLSPPTLFRRRTQRIESNGSSLCNCSRHYFLR